MKKGTMFDDVLMENIFFKLFINPHSYKEIREITLQSKTKLDQLKKEIDKISDVFVNYNQQNTETKEADDIYLTKLSEKSKALREEKNKILQRKKLFETNIYTDLLALVYENNIYMNVIRPLIDHNIYVQILYYLLQEALIVHLKI